MSVTRGYKIQDRPRKMNAVIKKICQKKKKIIQINDFQPVHRLIKSKSSKWLILHEFYMRIKRRDESCHHPIGTFIIYTIRKT